jgi:hypothetical protein
MPIHLIKLLRSMANEEGPDVVHEDPDIFGAAGKHLAQHISLRLDQLEQPLFHTRTVSGQHEILTHLLLSEDVRVGGNCISEDRRYLVGAKYGTERGLVLMIQLVTFNQREGKLDRGLRPSGMIQEELECADLDLDLGKQEPFQDGLYEDCRYEGEVLHGTHESDLGTFELSGRL